MSQQEMSSLQCLPTELILNLIKWMKPEDSLRLVQTCKYLATLTDYKVFWIECAQHVQWRRKVHHLQPHLLDIQELRASVLRTLKLDHKWSGIEGKDPGPLKKIELDTTLVQLNPPDRRAVTWAWFLEDGAHILCVIDDILVQLWHIHSQSLVLVFKTTAQMVRASKYSDDNYFVLATSVANDFERTLQIWKYEWAATDVRELSSPAFTIPVSEDSTFTFVTDNMAGFAYVDGSNSSELSRLDNINFVVINWRSPVLSNPVFCFTPLYIFGQHHAEDCKLDRFRMTRTSTQILMHFESTLRIVAFSFSLATFATLLGQNLEDGYQAKVQIKPTLKVRYELGANEGIGLPDDVWATWGDSCLWDGARVGLMSKADKLVGEELKNIIALSVLDLPTGDLVDAGDGIQNATSHLGPPEIQTTFTRPVVYIKPSDRLFSVTPDRHILVSQPKSTKSVVWALAPPNASHDSDSEEEGPQIQTLVLAHFPPFENSADMTAVNRSKLSKLQPTEDSSTSNQSSVPNLQDSNAPLEARGTITSIEVDRWLPINDKAMDIDLDDAYGRVAFGMHSGKVIILEFV